MELTKGFFLTAAMMGAIACGDLQTQDQTTASRALSTQTVQEQVTVHTAEVAPEIEELLWTDARKLKLYQSCKNKIQVFEQSNECDCATDYLTKSLSVDDFIFNSFSMFESIMDNSVIVKCIEDMNILGSN